MTGTRIEILEQTLEIAKQQLSESQSEVERMRDKLDAVRAVVEMQKHDEELWQIGAYYSEAMRQAVLKLHEVIGK